MFCERARLQPCRNDNKKQRALAPEGYVGGDRMKVDRLAVQIATTAVVSAIAVPFIGRSFWVFALILIEVAAIVFFSYLETRSTGSRTKGVAFCIVSAISADVFIGLLADDRRHILSILSAGLFSTLYLFRAVQEFRAKPDAPASAAESDQVSAIQAEPTPFTSSSAPRQ